MNEDVWLTAPIAVVWALLALGSVLFLGLTALLLRRRPPPAN